MDAVTWLTYDGLADHLGIERESARQQVKRQRWARRPGNDGKVRIGVPEDLLEPGSSPGTEALPIADVAENKPTDIPTTLKLAADALRGAGAGETVLELVAVIGNEALGRGLCAALRGEPLDDLLAGEEAGEAHRPFLH